ncbi:MAG: AMP-binding protein [Pseudomonadota bacterium]
MDNRGALPSATIGEALLRHSLNDPHSPALVCSELQIMTFDGLALQIHTIGEHLRAAGIGPASRVGIALPRCPEAALLSVAACCWATVLPINPTLSSGELEEELRRLRLDALVLPGWEAVPAWAQAGDPAFGLFRISHAATSLDEVTLTQVRPVARRALAAATVDSQSVCAIFRTSGTTGAAKRVPVTHANLLEMARKMRRWLQLSSADRSACVMPIYYNAGFKATLVVPLLIGCSVAMPSSAGPQDFQTWVSALGPTWLTGAPAYLQAVLDKLRGLPEGKPKHSLRFVLSTASYLPDDVRIELEARLGVPVLEFYGLCEAGMMTAPCLPPSIATPGTVGAAPVGELEIHDEDGRPLAPGRVGQIMLRGPSVMPGYLYDIEDAPTGLVDGWLATGDLGSLDEDRTLTIVGRTKEIINRGGEKISPYDVEKVLLRHPAVREAAVFAVPHPRLGENVAAAVVLNEGTSVAPSSLIEFMRDRLAPFQMPRHVHILPVLPRGNTGKISRSQLSADLGVRQRAIVPPDDPLQLQIAGIWQRILGSDDFGIDDDFFEVGGDSLQATEMLLELESQTRQAIEPSEIAAELTIRHLYRALVDAVASRHELIRLVREGEGRPLFICHGDFDGWGYYALRLAGLLDHDGPIYMLHPNLDEAAGRGTFQSMASCYIPQLLAIQPQGSFRLTGYCHGGLAAWEVAHQLERVGRQVEALVMIDTYSINARPVLRGVVRTVEAIGSVSPRLGGKLRDRGMPLVWSGTRRLMRHDREILRYAARRIYGGSGQAAAPSLRTAYYRAMSRYLPPRLQARLLVVLSDEYSRRREFAVEPWRRLAPQVDQEYVPGTHNTCITTHVVELAQALNRHLDAKGLATA